MSNKSLEEKLRRLVNKWLKDNGKTMNEWYLLTAGERMKILASLFKQANDQDSGNESN